MISNPYMYGLVIWAFTGMLACACAAQDAAKTPTSDAPAAADTAASAVVLPTMPQVRPAPMPGFDDDTAYVRSIADRATEHAARADQADDPARRTDHLLAATNLILAYQLEPTCTRRFLHIDRDEGGLDEAAIRTALDRADGFTGKAGKILNELKGRDDLPDGWVEESRHQLETLQAFASGLRAYLLPGEKADTAPAARRAASRLAPLLEDRSRQVVAAATFWQACLRSREADPKPTLSALAPALADPPRESMPYAFFARLLRCRLVAEHESPAVALALLLQVEERASDWLATDGEKQDAARAAQLARVQIIADWHGRLEGLDHAVERKWCVDRIGALVSAGFGENGDTVLRLTPAIPIIARLSVQKTLKSDAQPDQDQDDGSAPEDQGG